MKLILCGALLSASMTFAGPYDTWSKYRTVTIEAVGTTEAVTNFPLLVRLTNASAATGKDVLDSAMANGQDIRFTTLDGNTALKYQIERWTSSAAEIWVKVPSVGANTSTSIRMYWGKPGSTSESDGAAVFDTTNGFRAVYHMNEAEGANLSDATGLGHTAVVATVAPTSDSSGLGVGKAFAKVANSGYRAENSPKLNLDTAGVYTLSAWAKVPDCNTTGSSPQHVGRRALVAKMDNNGAGQYALMTQNGDPGNWQARLNGPAGQQYSGLVSCRANTWQYISATYSASVPAGPARTTAYDNGSLSAVANQSGTGAFTDTMALTIGKVFTSDTHGSFRMLGSIDEIRIAAVARSASWLKLDYETQRPDSAKVTLGASVPANTPVSQWTSWSHSREIRLNTGATGANVAGTVTDFPVLVRLTPAEATIFTQARSGGADIRFSKSDETELPYQIERWDATAQRAEIWVKVDTVKGNDSTQFIKMYWGNGSANSASSGRAVFDTTAYVGVWHLGDTTGVAPRPNAITGRFNATPVSFAPGYAAPTGLIGRAERLTGGSNGDSTTFLAINEGTPSTLFNFPQGQFTYTAWINPVSADNFARLISLLGTEAGEDRIFFAFSGENIIGRVWGTASHATNSTTPPNLGVWNHVAMTVKRGTTLDTTRLYHNGAQIAQATHNPMNNVERNYVRIGKDYINVGADQTYNGLIDESRISTVTRNLDYIKLSYESQRFDQKFTNIGAGVAAIPDAPMSVTVTTAGAPNNSIIVSWTPGGDGGAAITSYAVTASPGGATCTATAPATTCTVGGLEVGTQYTFTVRATNSVGQGPASSASATISPVVGLLPQSFVMRVDGHMKPFTYRLPADAMATTDKMTMRIADVHGRTVWSKSVSPRNEKVNELTWNGQSANGTRVSAGMYFVRITLVSEGKSVEMVRKAIDLTPAR